MVLRRWNSRWRTWPKTFTTSLGPLISFHWLSLLQRLVHHDLFAVPCRHVLPVLCHQVMRWPRVVAVLLGCLAPPPGAAKLKPGSLLVTIDKITAATCLTLGYEVCGS